MNLHESATSLINQTWEEKCHEFIELVQSGEEYNNHVLFHALNVELHLKGEIEVPDHGETVTFNSMDGLIAWVIGEDHVEELETVPADENLDENLDEVEAFIGYHCDP
jgi:hypothetical protein